jgi:hypothetical protein
MRSDRRTSDPRVPRRVACFVAVGLVLLVVAPTRIASAEHEGRESKNDYVASVARVLPWWNRTFEFPESLPTAYPETRNATYWSGLLVSATSSGKISMSPTSKRNRVFKATTGPNNGRDYADWALLTQDARTSRGVAGSEVWLRFSIYFPASFTPTGFTAGQRNSVFNGFTSFHNDSGYKELCPSELPSIAWTILNADPHGSWGKPQPRFRIHLLGGAETNDSNCRPKERWINGPKFRKRHWYNILQHIKFSPDERKGLFEAWIDGVRIASVRFPTLYRRPDGSISSAYFQCGYYRLASKFAASLFIDDVREGPSRRSVLAKRRR